MIAVIVQARMGSTRLPGKVMREIAKKPLLEILLDRLKLVQHPCKLVVATTKNVQDDCIEAFCLKKQVFCFRGSEEDVLERYWQAAKKVQAKTIVRITADCPLIDPKVIDQTIDFYLKSTPLADYASNTLKRTYPRGMDVEVFSFKALEKAFHEAIEKEEREHVTPYFYLHRKLFRCIGLERKKDDSSHRWTVDTEEDFKLVSKLFEEVLPLYPTFTLEDLLEVIKKHPDWPKINAQIHQNEIFKP